MAEQTLTLRDILTNPQEAISRFRTGENEYFDVDGLEVAVDGEMRKTTYQHKGTINYLLYGFVKIKSERKDYRMPFILDSEEMEPAKYDELETALNSHKPIKVSGWIRSTEDYHKLQKGLKLPTPLIQEGQEEQFYKSYPFMLDIISLNK